MNDEVSSERLMARWIDQTWALLSKPGASGQLAEEMRLGVATEDYPHDGVMRQCMAFGSFCPEDTRLHFATLFATQFLASTVITINEQINRLQMTLSAVSEEPEVFQEIYNAAVEAVRAKEGPFDATHLHFFNEGWRQGLQVMNRMLIKGGVMTLAGIPSMP